MPPHRARLAACHVARGAIALGCAITIGGCAYAKSGGVSHSALVAASAVCALGVISFLRRRAGPESPGNEPENTGPSGVAAKATEPSVAFSPASGADSGVRFDKIASQVPGMLFQLKRDSANRYAMAYASDGIADLFGVSAAIAATDVRRLFDSVHPEDREGLATSFLAAAEASQRWQYEFRTIPRPNEVRWLWAQALPEKHSDTSCEWHGFVADITDRKQAEQQHAENRTVLQSILASVDLAVFLVDVTPDNEFCFVEINPAYERLTGISAVEIRGKSPQELSPIIPTEMAACLRASFRRAVEAGASLEYEEPFYVHGRLLWWLTRLTPLRDGKGRVVRLVGRSLDITERKAVETRVQSLSERLQLATEAAKVGIWDFDLSRKKLVCDDRMLALYGLDPVSFPGTLAAWLECVHPEDRPRVDREFREAADGSKPFDTSFRIVRPDGDERDLQARGSVQQNAAGRGVRMVAVHWDVTAERRTQAQIEMARDQAEDLNRQLEDALERAHRLAQEAAAATVAKSEFLANMSHEIRTPLNAIIGMGALLLGTDLDKDQREFSETIRSSGEGLLALVNDILDYSKIESGRLELEERPFDVRPCVESCVDVLAARAAEKKLDLLHEIDPDVPAAIAGDVVRLKQIIVNLLSNAVKFTAKGEVYVSVGVVPAKDSGRVRLRFKVRDSGIGIPPDRMDRLFKTFSQVDASTTRQFGGTGLGLAISKRIVELMGGRIWVESTPGQGSVFGFEIEALPASMTARPYALGRAAILNGKRLLVVDDNATGCRIITQQVVSWGMVPRAVHTPSEALALAEQGERYDAILVDYALGEANGVQLIDQLKKSLGTAVPPIALMTAPGFLRMRDTLGLDGTINKPVKTAPLFDLLCELVQGRASDRGHATEMAVGMSSTHPVSILLAEDNPVNQRVAVLMLQRLGYKADVVANGREAVASALRQRYDLILMDVQMPEMDGLQASEEICARLRPQLRPRIVAMTANASIGDRDRCLAVGMSDFLTKPVRAEDLRRAVEETPLLNRLPQTT